MGVIRGYIVGPACRQSQIRRLPIGLGTCQRKQREHHQQAFHCAENLYTVVDSWL